MNIVKLTSTLALVSTLAIPGSSFAATDLIGSVTGTIDTAGAAVSANLAGTLTGSLANVAITGNSVNVNPAICANVVSSGNCTATANQAVTTAIPGSGTGAGDGLVNVGVTGNSVNLNPAVCLNALSSGSCTATANQTVNTTSTGGGLGGGVAQALASGARAGVITPVSALPRTGAEYLLFLLSFGGALAAAGASAFKQRFTATV